MISDFYIFKSAFRDTLRPKRFALALVISLIPAALALMFRFFNADQFDPYDAYNNAASSMVFGFILVILAVVYGTGVISQEVEQKTIVYLLTRPVPRWRILLMKYLAATCSICLTAWFSTLLLAVAAFGFGDRERSFLLRSSEITDMAGLVQKLDEPDDDVSKYIVDKLSFRAKRSLNPDKYMNQNENGIRRNRPRVRGPFFDNSPSGRLRRPLEEINHILLTDKKFYSDERFGMLQLTPETTNLLTQKPDGKALGHLNRLLLQQYYPQLIAAREPPVFPFWIDMATIVAGSFAYGALFLFVATLLNRPMIYGLVYAFGIESWVSNIPGKFQYLSIMTYIKALTPHTKLGQEPSGVVQAIAGAAPTDVISKTTSVIILVVLTLSFVACACGIFSNFEYVPREDAE